MTRVASNYPDAVSKSVLHPFSAYVKDNQTQLIRADGKPQISCPTGKKVNVVSAKFAVYDPYLQCTTHPLDTVKNTCKENPDSVICQNTNPDGTNKTCTLNGNGDCRPRDATPYLANMCNGKQQCNAVANSSYFGPYPCHGNSDKNYLAIRDQLPKVPSGEAQQNGDDSKQTYRQDYIVHGLYACV